MNMNTEGCRWFLLFFQRYNKWMSCLYNDCKCWSSLSDKNKWQICFCWHKAQHASRSIRMSVWNFKGRKLNSFWHSVTIATYWIVTCKHYTQLSNLTFRILWTMWRTQAVQPIYSLNALSQWWANWSHAQCKQRAGRQGEACERGRMWRWRKGSNFLFIDVGLYILCQSIDP